MYPGWTTNDVANTRDALLRAMMTLPNNLRHFAEGGSEQGGQRAAALYSIIGSCTLQGVERWRYLADVLQS